MDFGKNIQTILLKINANKNKNNFHIDVSKFDISLVRYMKHF